jgi:tRNA 2-thiouridine synthesizing protein A
MNMNFDKEFDASGLSCPLPILKTKKALADMASGQVLKLVATDSGSIKDMQAFADQTGNTLLSTEEASGSYTFYMKKK